MKKFVIAATMILVFPVVAHSQQGKGPLTARTDAETKRDKEIDKAYQDAMKRPGAAKEQASQSDPWKTVRPSGNNDSKN
jgi:hypothetical protein